MKDELLRGTRRKAGLGACGPERRAARNTAQGTLHQAGALGLLSEESLGSKIRREILTSENL